MKVLLVTGGAGFIGSHFIKYFLCRNKNFIVVNIDKLVHGGNLNNLREVQDSPRCHFIKGDICNYELINYVLRKYRPDFVVNFAEEKNNTEPESEEYFNRSNIFAETNIMGTMTLLDGLKYIWGKRNLRGNRFIQVSTDDVYGSEILSGVGGRTDNSFFEEAALAPDNIYSASKAAADIMVSSFSKAYNLPTIITRCCNNYGPYQSTNHFVPYCISRILQDKPLKLNSTDYLTKEWIHVQDNNIALIRAMFYGRPGEIYNISTGEEASNIDIAKKILGILGKSGDSIDFMPHSQTLKKRCILNNCKAKCQLNWVSKIKLEEGLKDTISWYRNNLHHLNISN